MAEFLTAAAAAELIKDQDKVAICGVGAGIVEPYAMIEALAERYQNSGKPEGITLIHASGIGDRRRRDRGLYPLAQEGLIGKIIGGHWYQCADLAQMAADDRLAAYNLPQGVMSHLYRAAAADKPGIFTKTGLHTCMDPRQGGGKLNASANEDMVSLIEIEGEEFLFYKTTKPDVCLIRATTADEDGYLSMEDEVAYLDVMDMAMAAHNNGGIVIAQVGQVVKSGSIHPKKVRVPGFLVDAIVVVEDQEQLYGVSVDPHLSGDKQFKGTIETVIFDHRTIIARRALLEARPGFICSAGVGMADGIGLVAHEEGMLGKICLTTDVGNICGIPAQGAYFGAAYNNKAVIKMSTLFDFYEGGGVDMAFLSFAQFDSRCNVNVSRFGGKIAGAGGFIDTSQFCTKSVFCGTLTSGGLETKVKNGNLKIAKEGRFRKCPQKVDEITYNGDFAREQGREAIIITERAVFHRGATGLKLIEYAPGMDVEKDILSVMDFQPEISSNLSEMDSRLFQPKKMDMEEEWERGEL